MKINAEMLRGILDCMHAEADEREKHSAQIRSIVTAAKDKGFDTKAIRKVFVRERMDEAERSKQDDLIETYEGALGGKGRALAAIASGAPVGEAAKANGVHRATVARARHGNRHVANEASNATPPHDPSTGELTETQEPCGIAEGREHKSSAGGIRGATTPATGPSTDAQLRVLSPSNAQQAGVESGPQDPITYQDHLQEFRRSPDPAPTRPPADTRSFDDITGPIPEKLRRVQAQ